jgi:hypothetical protein
MNNLMKKDGGFSIPTIATILLVLCSCFIFQIETNVVAQKGIFEVTYPIQNETVSGTVKIYGTMMYYPTRNDSVSIEFDHDYYVHPIELENQTGWYYNWNTTNCSNGFHRIVIGQLPPITADFFVRRLNVYVINPYPVLIERTNTFENSSGLQIYQKDALNLKIPDLPKINSTNMTIRWDFGDGNISDRSIVDHQYSVPGKYLVSLKVVSDKRTVDLHEEITVLDNPTEPKPSDPVDLDRNNAAAVLTSMSLILLIVPMTLFIVRGMKRS